jgi:hypothetical protein
MNGMIRSKYSQVHRKNDHHETTVSICTMTDRSFHRLTLSLLCTILTPTELRRLLLLLLLLPNVVESLAPGIVGVERPRSLHVISCGLCRAQECHHLLKASLETPEDSDNVNEEYNISKTAMTTTTMADVSSACPFSKTYPRYRIDLTTKTRRKKQDAESIFSRFSSPFRDVQKSFQQNQLKQQLLQQDPHAQLIIQPELDGIAAMAFLWDQASNLATTTANNNNNNNNTVMIVLPDASPCLVHNFVEIIQWITMSLPDLGGHYNDALLTASLVDDTKNLNVPACKLQCIDSRQSRQLTRNKQNNQKEEKVKVNDISQEKSIVNTRTRKWVKRILVEQGICPFTKSDRMSGQGLADLGVPVGSIAYHATFQTHALGLLADTWRAIHNMIQAGPTGKEGVSSILLAAPAFDDDFDYWAGPIFAMLEASVVAAQAEAEIGVVCFHPKYATPDGKSWPGFGHMHSVPMLEKWYREYSTFAATKGTTTTVLSNLDSEWIAAGGAWQRRTPHATINVLRAKQLEMAESRRQSAKMYTENIEKLVGINGIGNDKLALDLEMERQFRN